MSYNVSAEESRRAAQPHELFLINLILNHVFFFVSTLGLAGSYPYLPLVVPLVSFSILGYSLRRARRALESDPWFVGVHWQVCARRSRLFIAVLGGLCLVLLLGWAGYLYLHLPKVLVIAICGVGAFPTVVTMLILIVMESDAMHQARHGRLPKWAAERFPESGAKLVQV